MVDTSVYILTDCRIGDLAKLKKTCSVMNYNLVNISKKECNTAYGNIVVNLIAGLDKLLRYTASNNHQTVKMLYSKDSFAKYMTDNNFESYVPKTFYNKNDIAYPCIVKPVNGYSGIDINIYHTEIELRSTNKINNPKFIIQEYIYNEYIMTGHFLCKNGNIVSHIIYVSKTPCKYYVQQGAIKDYNKRDMTEYERNIFTAILDSVKYHGFCCINYCYDKNNNLKIFEINPRIGGSLVDNTDDFNYFIKMAKTHNVMNW